MASIWQKTLFYLGLVEEEELQGARPAPDAGVAPVEPTQAGTPPTTPVVARVRPPGVVAGRRVEPPGETRRRISPNPEHAEAGLYVTTPEDRRTPTVEPETHVIVARTFSDAQTLADDIRAGRPVVLDLRSTEPEMVRRLVDFTSGLTYALDGRMGKIAKGVVLVTPQGVTLSAQEQDRLARLGLYGDGTT
ncbi:MAG TPA: cell division protein SepF [Actinobacteria bacterium]|nr:cell division protein SepF [Actinomycetota bacterium]